MSDNELHVNTYNSLADEYRERINRFEVKDLFLIGPMSSYVRKQFTTETAQEVLDVGCGSGLNCRMLSDEGIKVTGIELAPRMAEVAAQTAPLADIICGDFVSYKFESARYSGVFCKAFLHLYPKEEALMILRKIREILKPAGLLYISVSGAHESSEAIREKVDYAGNFKRFKRIWSETELHDAVQGSGFEISYWSEHRDFNNDKTWLDVWAVK